MKTKIMERLASDWASNPTNFCQVRAHPDAIPEMNAVKDPHDCAAVRRLAESMPEGGEPPQGWDVLWPEHPNVRALKLRSCPYMIVCAINEEGRFVRLLACLPSE